MQNLFIFIFILYLFPCRSFQVRSLAADPVSALTSLAVESMEVLLSGGEDDDDEVFVYLSRKMITLLKGPSVWLFVTFSLS